MGGHACPEKYECSEVVRDTESFKLCLPKLGSCDCTANAAAEKAKRGCHLDEACEQNAHPFKVGYQQCWEVNDGTNPPSHVWSACMTDKCIAGEHPWDCDDQFVEKITQYTPTVDIRGYVSSPNSDLKTLIFEKTLEGAKDLKPGKMIRLGYDIDRTDLSGVGISDDTGITTLNYYVLASDPVFVPKIEAIASGKVKQLRLEVSLEFFASSVVSECENP